MAPASKDPVTASHVLLYRLGVRCIKPRCSWFCCFPFLHQESRVWISHPMPTLSMNLSVQMICIGLLIISNLAESKWYLLSILEFPKTLLVSILQNSSKIAPWCILRYNNLRITIYRVPLVYISKLTQITFKRNSHQVISISCYPEVFVEAFLRLYAFTFVVSGGKACMCSKGILRVRAVTLSTPNHMTRRKGFMSLKKF